MQFSLEKDVAIQGVFMPKGEYDIAYSDLTPESPYNVYVNIAGQLVYKTRPDKTRNTDCTGKLVLNRNDNIFVMIVNNGVIIEITSKISDDEGLFNVIGYGHLFNAAKKKLDLIHQLGLISNPDKLNDYLDWCENLCDNNIKRNQDLRNALNYVQNYILENDSYKSANHYMQRELLLGLLGKFEDRKKCFYG